MTTGPVPANLYLSPSASAPSVTNGARRTERAARELLQAHEGRREGRDEARPGVPPAEERHAPGDVRRVRRHPRDPAGVPPLPTPRGDRGDRGRLRAEPGPEPRGPRGDDRDLPPEAARDRHALRGVGPRGLLPGADDALGPREPRAVPSRREGDRGPREARAHAPRDRGRGRRDDRVPVRDGDDPGRARREGSLDEGARRHAADHAQPEEPDDGDPRRPRGFPGGGGRADRPRRGVDELPDVRASEAARGGPPRGVRTPEAAVRGGRRAGGPREDPEAVPGPPGGRGREREERERGVDPQAQRVRGADDDPRRAPRVSG